jgi:hypothetical protein
VKNALCHTERPHIAKGLCQSCYEKKRYAANREERKIKQRESYARNVEKRREFARIWARNNKQKRAEYNKEYRKMNTERLAKNREEWGKKNPDRVKVAMRKWHLKRSGWTPQAFDAALEAQNHKCLICCVIMDRGRNKTSACADHDHETGKPRGVLCRNCNIFLGFYEASLRGVEKYTLLETYLKRYV